MSELRLKSWEFRREREASWRELETLVFRAERGGLRALDDGERLRLPLLYRSALSSLSVARSVSLDKALLTYLEALSQRAYFVVYGPRRALGRALADFFLRDFPATVRRFLGPLLLATAILVAGALAGYLLVDADTDRFYTFVPDGLAQGRDPGASTAFLRDGLYDEERPADQLSGFAAFLFTNNAKVGMLCFAIGFLAGVPVFLLLFTNGLTLGAMTWVYADRGLAVDWWGWLLPHGITELLAVVLCAAGGLALAGALVFPGRYRRLESLARTGRQTGVLIVGAVVLFFLAALLEGIFRQRVTDPGLRYLVATSTGFFWLAYLSLAGRRRSS